MVPVVPTTPIRPVRVADTAASAPGWITPTTGMSSSSRSVASAWAVAVLQAMTSSLMSRDRRNLAASRANRRTVSGDFEP